MDAVRATLEQLTADEGYRRLPYRCSEGYLTIGYGTNIEDGIDEEEAAALMSVRVKRDYIKLRLIGLGDIHHTACSVCLNMCYQLGFAGFMKFKNTIKLLQAHEYVKASYEMLDSAWATQTPNRARRLSRLLRSIKE